MADRPAQREKNRGIVRGLHLEAIGEAGAARAAALQEAETQLQRVGQLLPDALDAGISLTEISRITGVSRPTLYELRTKYGDSGRDLDLVILQSAAVAGALPVADLAERMGVSEGEVMERAGNFEKQGLMDIEPEETPDGPVPVLVATPKGVDLLEAWFEDRQDEGIEP